MLLRSTGNSSLNRRSSRGIHSLIVFLAESCEWLVHDTLSTFFARIVPRRLRNTSGFNSLSAWLEAELCWQPITCKNLHTANRPQAQLGSGLTDIGVTRMLTVGRNTSQSRCWCWEQRTGLEFGILQFFSSPGRTEHTPRVSALMCFGEVARGESAN